MQQLIIFILFCIAVYYLYRKLIKNRGCNCSGKSCRNPRLPSQNKEKTD